MEERVTMAGQMNIQIKQWGNSPAIRIPAPELKRLNLNVGDTVKVTIEPAITLNSLLAQIKPEGEPPELVDFGPDIGNETTLWEKER